MHNITNIKTHEQITHYATQFARDFYYSDYDDKLVWQPFEHWSEEDLSEHVWLLAEQVAHAMLWAVGQADAADQT